MKIIILPRDYMLKQKRHSKCLGMIYAIEIGLNFLAERTALDA